MHQFTVSLHVYLNVTCHQDFGRTMTEMFYKLLRSQGGGTDTETRVSTKSGPWRRKLSRCYCRTQTRGLEVTTPALYH